MGAAMNGYPEVAGILLKAGADANAKNDAGETSADLAMIKQHTEVHKVLQCWKHMGLLQDGKWHSPLSQQDSEEIRGILTVSIEGQTLLSMAKTIGNQNAYQDITQLGT
mmetsp:Transcript_36208/g.56548  ORF Transcript_36208/g.56548 Transcript_36208/m.56548 type:complete len:109 (-) Transcript_36208:141-467(-)